MKLRIARHTDRLEEIAVFYTVIIGLENLGGFREHEGYDGVFLGLKHENWHLEFTSNAESPIHQPDEEDALVFYPGSAERFNAIIDAAKAGNIPFQTSKNPYWQRNAFELRDPDGFSVIIVDPAATLM